MLHKASTPTTRPSFSDRPLTMHEASETFKRVTIVTNRPNLFETRHTGFDASETFHNSVTQPSGGATETSFTSPSEHQAKLRTVKNDATVLEIDASSSLEVRRTSGGETGETVWLSKPFSRLEKSSSEAEVKQDNTYDSWNNRHVDVFRARSPILEFLWNPGARGVDPSDHEARLEEASKGLGEPQDDLPPPRGREVDEMRLTAAGAMFLSWGKTGDIRTATRKACFIITKFVRTICVGTRLCFCEKRMILFCYYDTHYCLLSSHCVC